MGTHLFSFIFSLEELLLSMPPVLPLTNSQSWLYLSSFHATKPAFASPFLSCCLTFPGRHSWSRWFIIPSLAVLARAYGVPLQRGGCDAKLQLERWHLAEATCLKAWHILLFPAGVTSLSGLLVWWCFSLCNQAQHSHFSETPLDTSPFKLIEKLVCGWLRGYKLFLITAGTLFCFLRHELWMVPLNGRRYLKAAESLFECLIELEMGTCSCWAGVPHPSCANGHFR